MIEAAARQTVSPSQLAWRAFLKNRTAVVGMAIVAVFSYGATAYLIGELDASDYRYFRSMLNPQGTLEYVVHEILGKRGH